MTKYLIKRVLRGLLSIVAVVVIVMILIYSLMDRNLIFANDNTYSHLNNNSKTTYKYRCWEQYGYIDYVPYAEYINDLSVKGEITEDVRKLALSIGLTEKKDNATAKTYVEKFTKEMSAKGFIVTRLDAVTISTKSNKVVDGGQQVIFAHKNINVFVRLFNYFTHFIEFDDINYANTIVGDRKLTFTFNDPYYDGEKFSPALIGNGTKHKYLIYFDDKFPYFHQNLININLGTSYSVNKGIDVFDTMTSSQGSYVFFTVNYPTGLVEESPDDLHTVTYIEGSKDSIITNQHRFVDDYTNVKTNKTGLSKMGYSFIIGLIAVGIAYFLGVPLGVIMTRKKDKLFDKIGTLYVVFIIAVPSLAYIFLFKAVGGSLGFPTTFNVDINDKWMFFLPIISLALPQMANLMKWTRRYMIDQMNSEYVKFARSSGLSENEIFSKHVLKNAIIPIVHGIPASILGALTGAIITERVYVVPGAGNLLTTAINQYDNGVIVGVTLFYASLSVIALILGDILMATIDPRISYVTKER